MWIFFFIRMGMMQAMHDAIGPGTHIGGTMGDIGAEMKKFFPAPGHAAKVMCSIPVIEEGLKKQRNVPMQNNKYENKSHTVIT